MIRFTELYRDGGDAEYISTTPIQTDWPTYLYIQVNDMLDNDECASYRYYVTLSAIAPDALPLTELQKVHESYGWAVPLDEMTTQDKVSMLASYMGGAPLNTWQGNNFSKLLQLAREEAQRASMLIGFYLDCPINRIGTTGWQMLQGDILGGLNR